MSLTWLTWKRVLTFLAILLIVGGLTWHFWPRHKVPANPQIARLQSGADTSVATKDYITAADSYLAAANTAADSGNYGLAESLLKEATAKVPDSYLNFDFWIALYAVAAHQNDKSLEISSLQKAIAKAPSDNIPASLIKDYQTKLSQLTNG